MDSNLDHTITSTRDAQKQWQQWFRTCERSHTTCRIQPKPSKQSFLPDRLIEIIDNPSDDTHSWRLRCQGDMHHQPYLTLSHCWGDSQHMRLMKDNYQSFLQGFNESTLPRTYRDAFDISIKLGFRFIWIDSLCIIQDDAQDWRTQSSLMGSIYKHASCNIAATWAKDGNDGCFHARDTIVVDSASVKMQLSYILEPLISEDPADDYHQDLTHSPLNSRGWVIQERYLARRQLSFAARQVHWECSELVASEQFPSGIPKHHLDFGPFNIETPPKGKPSMRFCDRSDLRQAWSALVDFYSECDLTHASDKLTAISGLAAEFRDLTGDIYLAGLWREDLRAQLSWSTDFDVRRYFSCSRQATYRAPTWSWASIDGPVMFDPAYLRRLKNAQDYAWCIEVLDASVQSQQSAQLHSFISAKLLLRGIAIWSHEAPSPSPRGLGRFFFKTKSNDSSPLISIGAELQWDERLPSDIDPAPPSRTQQQLPPNILFMITYIQHGEIGAMRGIMLCDTLSIADARAFTRVGSFMVCDEDLETIAMAVFQVCHLGDIHLENKKLADFVHTVSVT